MTTTKHTQILSALALLVVGIPLAALAGNPGNCQQYDGSGGEVAYVCDGNTIEVVSADITASPNPVTAGQASTLTWTGSTGSSCVSSQFDTGYMWTGSVNVYPSDTTAYTVTCSGNYVSASDSVTVSISGPPPPPSYPDLIVEWSAIGQVGTAARAIITANVKNQGAASTGN